MRTHKEELAFCAGRKSIITELEKFCKANLAYLAKSLDRLENISNKQEKKFKKASIDGMRSSYRRILNELKQKKHTCDIAKLAITLMQKKQL